MPTARVIFQAQEKIGVICVVLLRAGILQRGDMKALAAEIAVPYTTLKTSVAGGRLSPKIEDAIASLARFDREHDSWVDDAVPEARRRSCTVEGYAGRDTAEEFRHHLDGIWRGGSVTFRSTLRDFNAVDPHMVRHEFTDLGQSTAAGTAMQFFLAVHFEPFFHKSGMIFGFRKATVTLEISCVNGARAVHRLGSPVPVQIGNAVLSGDKMAQRLRWQIERDDPEPAILSGEYATRDAPIVTIEDYDDGTVLMSRVEVNLYDRATCASKDTAEPSPNKQALIEQIFSKQLADTQATNGWVALTRQENVIARYER